MIAGFIEISLVYLNLGYFLFFRRLKEKNENGIYDNFEILSSHPNMNKRVKNILAFKVPDGFTAKESWINIDEMKKRVEQ